ncbi:MAG: hypothetical protein IIW01_03775 [Thermoguttaceae bacterium]|nr:hypothetical protein [Thermoguttaceae bacterium]
MKKLSALLFALLTAAVPCAALAVDAPVYSPSPCEPVAAPVCGPVGESVATACPGGVCQINVDVSNSCPGGVCAVASNGPPVAKQVRAWSRTRVVERSDRRSSVRSVAAFDACAVRKRGAFANRRVAATVVVRSNACSTGTCATAAPPLPCAPVCR